MKKIFITMLIILASLLPFQYVKADDPAYTAWSFPAYNGSIYAKQIRVTNFGTANTVVTITLSGSVIDTYTLAPLTMMNENYNGQNGPITVISSGGQLINATLRVWSPSNGIIDIEGSQLIAATNTPTKTATPGLSLTPSVTPTATFAPSPTATLPPLCEDGTGFPYYPMCPNTNYPVYFYATMTATWNNTLGTYNNINLTSPPESVGQWFGVDTTCKAMFGNEKLYNLLGSGVGLSEVPGTFPTNKGSQKWLGEIHSDSGASINPVPVAPFNPIVGTIIEGGGEFYSYNPASTSKNCDNATVFHAAGTYTWITRVVGLYPSYTFNGITYSDVAIVSLKESTGYVYWYGYRKNFGNVFTCYGSLVGVNISGSCWQSQY